jgi:hypothetical protein
MKKNTSYIITVSGLIFLICLTLIGCFGSHHNSSNNSNSDSTTKILIDNREVSSTTEFNQTLEEIQLEIPRGACEDGFLSVTQTIENSSSEIRNNIVKNTKPVFLNSKVNIANLSNEYEIVSKQIYSIKLTDKNHNRMLLSNAAKITFNIQNDYPSKKYFAVKKNDNNYSLLSPIQYTASTLTFETYSFSDWYLIKEKKNNKTSLTPVITASSAIYTNGKDANFKNDLEVKISAPYDISGKYVLNLYGRKIFPLSYNLVSNSASNTYQINLSTLDQPETSADLATYSLKINLKEYKLNDYPEFIILDAEYTDPVNGIPYASQKRITFMQGEKDIEVTPQPYVISSTPDNTDGIKIIKTNDKITINFSQPMEKSSVEKALRISPEISGKINTSWSSDNKKITINCNFEDFETYTLTISKSAKSETDLSLENDFVLIFGTPKPTSDNSNTNTGTNTGNQTGTNTGNQTGTNTGNQTGTNTGNQTGTNTGNQTGTNTGNQTGTNTGNQTGTNTGNQTGTNTGNQTGTNTGNQTGTNTGNQTGSNTGTSTETPQIISISPQAYAENIKLNTSITIKFSKEMNKSSVNNALTITPTIEGGISTNWSDNKTLVISPNNNLLPNTSYQVSIGNTALDLDNAAIESFSSKFKTISSPLIASVSPHNQESDVALNTPIVITFTKPMNKTKTQEAISISPSSSLNYNWENDDKKLTITNSENWSEDNYIRVLINSNAIDNDSIPISNPLSLNFRTMLFPNVIINSCKPSPNSVSVATNTTVIVLFNKEVNKTSAEEAFKLRKDNSATDIPGTFIWENNKMIFTPNSTLTAGAKYNVNILSTYHDINNNKPQSNSVWSFTTALNEGDNWTNLYEQKTDETGFVPRSNHSMVSFQNKLWIIGGKTNTGSPLSDVYNSSDGKNWTLVTNSAAFGARFGHSCTVYNNKIWLSGGIKLDDETGVSYLNDIWNSSDGVNWTQVARVRETYNYVDDPVFSKRAYHNMLTYNNKLWVMLGESPDGLVGDIWCSSDGITWTDRSNIVIPRKNASAVVFKDSNDSDYESILVIGGFGENSNKQTVALNELALFKEKNSNWIKESLNLDINPRFSASAVVYNNRIWLISGAEGSENNPTYLSEVLASNDGHNWTKMPINPNFKARANHQATIFNAMIVISGGENSDNTYNEVWSIK